MLKFKLDNLDDLDDKLKDFYEEKDGAFYLKVDGIPKPEKDDSVTKELEARLKKLEENNKSLMAEKVKAREDAEKAALEAARKGGDIEALEKSWQEKLDSTVKEKEDQINQLSGMVSQLTVGSAATALAAELFGEHAELMEHHIKSRLTYEVQDGTPKVRVVEDGKPTAKSLEDLKKEFQNNAKFAPFVVASKASGGGPLNKGGAGVGKKFDEMTDVERIKLHREDPATYKRVVEEFRAKEILKK